MIFWKISIQQSEKISKALLLFKPRGIHYVIIGDPAYLPGKIGGIDVFDFLCRDACIDGTRLYHRILGNDCPGCNDGVAFDDAVVHYNGAHAYQHVVLNRATVDYGIVAYRYVIAYDCRVFLVRAVDYRPILDIYLITYLYIVYIAPDNSVEPHTALRA